MTDFANAEAINTLLDSHKYELNAFPNLIIDVRLNRGGSDDAFFNLLPYLFEVKHNHVIWLIQQSGRTNDVTST